MVIWPALKPLPCNQARSWAFMSKDVMHGMVIWPALKPLPEILGHSSLHSSKVVLPSCWLKTYMGLMKDVVGAATEADTAVAATRALRDLPWGLATRGSSAAGMVE